MNISSTYYYLGNSISTSQYIISLYLMILGQFGQEATMKAVLALLGLIFAGDCTLLVDTLCKHNHLNHSFVCCRLNDICFLNHLFTNNFNSTTTISVWFINSHYIIFLHSLNQFSKLLKLFRLLFQFPHTR